MADAQFIRTPGMGAEAGAGPDDEWPPRDAVIVREPSLPEIVSHVPEWANTAEAATVDPLQDEQVFLTPTGTPIRTLDVPMMVPAPEPMRPDMEETVHFAPATETPVRVDEMPFMAHSHEVLQSDMQTFFPQTQGVVRNPDGAVIYASKPPITNGTDVTMAPNGAPVANGDTILGLVLGDAGGVEDASGPGTGGGASVSNESPQFTPALAGPTYNDREAGVVHHHGVGLVPEWADPGRPTSNEGASFVPGSAPLSNQDVQFGGGGAGVVIVDQGAVTFVRTGPAMEVNTDLNIGGGGDMTRKAREDEVAFLGQSMLSVGGTDVSTALVGDMTKVIGQDDVNLTANAGHTSNEAPVVTETGDPTFNPGGFRDVQEGAVGVPLKRNVS